MMPNQIPTISIIGAGNIAWHLAHALNEKQVPIIQIINRGKENGIQLASEVNSSYIERIEDMQACDIIIICVSDSAIGSVASQIKSRGIVVHTCGSVDMEVLNECSDEYGVLYPLQTFSKAISLDFKQVPFCIEASTAQSFEKINSLASLLSDKVYPIDSYHRRLLHLSAVFACNFTNHCYAVAEDIAKRNNMDFGILKPLMEETLRKALMSGPYDVQTGPAIRNNKDILKMHEGMLEGLGDYQKLYNFMSESIQQLHQSNIAKKN